MPVLASPPHLSVLYYTPRQMNPHYAFAAIFALGLHGIRNKLELTIPPTSQIKPADHAATYDRLPKDLHEATQRFKAPESMARK